MESSKGVGGGGGGAQTPLARQSETLSHQHCAHNAGSATSPIGQLGQRTKRAGLSSATNPLAPITVLMDWSQKH